MKKKKILYLITRENVLDAGVLKSQVFELLGKVKAEDKSCQILILNFPSFHKFWRSRNKLGELKETAKSLEIELKIIPILPIGRSTMPRWAIPFLLIQTVPWIIAFSLVKKINIYHARSYLSALILFHLKKLVPRIEFIFDMRGPYLQEGETHGRWQKGDKDYQYWEGMERRLFNSARVVVAQSSGLVKYVKKISPKAKVVNITCCADMKNFDFSERELQSERQKYKLEGKFIVVYSGSLGSFHEPKFISDSYKILRNNIPNPHFLVLTHSSTKELEKSLKLNKVPRSEYTILQHPKNLSKLITMSQVGLHVMNDLPITPYVIAVKFSEYLAAGLPVIISSSLTSIVSVVERERCGIVFDGEKVNTGDLRDLIENYRKYKENALSLAQTTYSTQAVARSYEDIYKGFND